jgi:hypothetical protein
MQKKESKTNKHFYFSMAKSFIRILGCTYLFYGDYKGAAILLAFAEGLGIAEEF